MWMTLLPAPSAGMGDYPNPAALTAQIKESATIEALLRMPVMHESKLNHIHLSACWISLARVAMRGQAERRWLQLHADVLDPLVQHTV